MIEYRCHIHRKRARIRANRRCLSFHERLTSIYSGKLEVFPRRCQEPEFTGLFSGSINVFEETGFERDLVSFYWRDVESPRRIAAEEERERLIGRFAVK